MRQRFIIVVRAGGGLSSAASAALRVTTARTEWVCLQGLRDRVVPYPRRNAYMVIENLEDRRLLSVSFNEETGVLTLAGTANIDRYVVAPLTTSRVLVTESTVTTA